jgi:NarL family two-component system sensor histidine kinase LiaS
LKSRRNHIVLRIADDGIGFTPEQDQATGLGLVSMRERVESIGGTVKITSVRQKGTVVEAAAPLNHASRK